MASVNFWSFTLASCALLLSVWAVVGLNRVLVMLRSHSSRSAMELSASLAATQSSFDSLSKTVRRLSSRYGMAERRAADGTSRAGGEIPLSELTGDEFRREARRRLIRPGQPVGKS